MSVVRFSISVVAAWALSSVTVGCVPVVATSPPQVKPPQVVPQPLSADELADILGLNVWTATFEGKQLEVWLEIEEEGQSTLPKRIPEGEGALGRGPSAGDAGGKIQLWWTRREDRQGGELHFTCGGSSYGYGLNKDAFTFAWPSLQANTTTKGARPPIEAMVGRPFVIVDYDAKESFPEGDTRKPRRVHLKLMGNFPDGK